MLKGEFRSARFAAVVAIFAALIVVSDSLMSLPEFPSGVWYSWSFLFEPLTGIIIGPLLGFAATFAGVMIGHYVYFIDVYEFLFTVGAPIGAAVSALMFRGKWKPVLIYFTAFFAAYFATPVAWQLPLWGMWDTCLAFVVLIVAIFMIEKAHWRNNKGKLPVVLAVAAFVGLEADVAFRILLLVPLQTYRLFYGFRLEDLQAIWVAGAVFTPIKVALSIFATMAIGQPLIKVLRRAGLSVDASGSPPE